MPSLLFIDHSYHKKTSSSVFMQQLLGTRYDITVFSFDPYSDGVDIYCGLQQRYFNTVILWQILPHRDILDTNIHFQNGIFFPMFDGAPKRTDPIWQEYSDFRIINFSRTLHEELLTMGLDSRYIQYFPEPVKETGEGDIQSAFLWQRLTFINVNTVSKLFANSPLDHIHIHNAPDPEQQFVAPVSNLRQKVTFSKWFSTKTDMYRAIDAAAFYIAPRVQEGIGMSFLEAMARGRCVVAADHPTMNEYIEHGKTGFLFQPDAVIPLEYSKEQVRIIQQNTRDFMQAGYEHWLVEKEQILDWVEEEKTTRLNVLFDATLLAVGVTPGTSRTGVYFVAWNIFQQLVRRNDIQLFLYCDKNQKKILDDHFKEATDLNFKCAILDENSDLSFINCYLNIYGAVPVCIRKYNWITSYLFLHDLIPFIHPEWFSKNNQQYFTTMLDGLLFSDFFFANSEYTREDYRKHVPHIDSKKITVTPLAAGKNFYPCKNRMNSIDIQKKFRIPEGKNYILSVCSLEPRKNLIMAMKAFIQFIRQNNVDDLVYVLAGTPWKGFDELLKRELPEYIHYKDKIIRTGYVDDKDLAPLYSGAMFFVYTSLYEGFGLPPLEAMQCNIPVITSNTTSLPEIIGDAGIMIDPQSLEQHLAAYSELYFKPDRREELSSRGLQRAKLFSWKRCADIIVKKMQEIENSSSPKITVATVTLNAIRSGRKQYLRQCIESVHRQRYSGEIEHLVIDGASDDGTLEMLEEYQRKGWITYFSEKDSGIYNAMNKAIDRASGKYIAFLNSDDYWNSDYAVSISAHALENSEADFSYSGCYYLQDNTYVGILPQAMGSFYVRMPLSHQAMFTRRDVLKNYRFDEGYRSSADYDLVLRLILGGAKAVNVPYLFTAYRYGGMSDTNVQLTGAEESIDIIHKLFSMHFPISHEECKEMFYTYKVPEKLFHALMPLIDPSVQETAMTAWKSSTVTDGTFIPSCFPLVQKILGIENNWKQYAWGSSCEQELDFVPKVEHVINLKGWHELESTGIWTEEQQASFTIRTLPQDYTLTLQLTPYLGNTPQRSVHCLINGEEVLCKALYDITELTIPVARSQFIDDTPLLTVMLRSEEPPASPQECGQSSDPRRLGFMLHSCLLEVVSKNNSKLLDLSFQFMNFSSLFTRKIFLGVSNKLNDILHRYRLRAISKNSFPKSLAVGKHSKKKLLFVGNCQAGGLLELFSYSTNFTNAFTWKVFPGVFAITPEEVTTLREELRTTDVFLFHPVQESYRNNIGVGSKTLKSFLPQHAVCLSVSPTYWDAYNPELFYLRNPDGSHVTEQFDYHNRLIFKSFIEGLSVKDTILRFSDPTVYAGSLPVAMNSLEELKHREMSLDIKTESFIRRNFHEQRLFWTLNHPTNALLLHIADQIFSLLNVKNDLQKKNTVKLWISRNCLHQ